MTIGPEQRNAEMRGEPYESASERRAKNYHAENIDLRGQLEMSRKATSAAQELLEAERGAKYRLMSALDTEKLLRVVDAATITDLQRQLREAEAQLKAQRLSAKVVAEIRAYEPRWAIDAKKRAEVVAENAELRRTISLKAKTEDAPSEQQQ